MRKRPLRRGLVAAFMPAAGGHKEESIWLISLSDLMTNLMLFFIVLYALTRLPESERARMLKQMSSALAGESMPKVAVDEKQESQKVREEAVANALKQLLDTKESEVVLSEKLIRIRMATPIWFDSGSDRLSKAGQERMAPIRGMLEGLGNQVIIEGFTDNVPIRSGKFHDNWELSAARANAIRRYLTEDGKVSEDRIVVAAYGEHKPVAPNDTPDGRRRNRRIEITVVRR